MKRLATTVALLSFYSISSYAGDNSIQTKKTPFFRPHYNARRSIGAKPHARGDVAIVNAASYEPGVSPGGLATIFGDILSQSGGIVYAYSNPLPDILSGVQVFIGGIPAPIYGIAFGDANTQDQISVQVPYAAPVGPSAAEIKIVDSGAVVADFFADSFTEDPGIFTYTVSGSTDNFAIAEASDYSLIGPDNPANPGDALVLYVTGLGPLDDSDLIDGYGAPTSEPLARTLDPFQVTVDNEVCNVFFSGLAPGFVGLYQINFYVPQDAAQGNLSISIQDQYANSAIATLPVR
jgi:uncharacterized protein (TIGR03437 family)